jgi:hypothetical protein
MTADQYPGGEVTTTPPDPTDIPRTWLDDPGPDGGHRWKPAEPGGLDTCARCGMYRFAYYNAHAPRRPCSARLERADVSTPDAEPLELGADAPTQVAGEAPARWRVRLICCGKDDGAEIRATWEEADAFRQAYIVDPRHSRSAIVERVDDARPAAVADQAGEDVYLGPARAYLVVTELDEDAGVVAAWPWLRAVVDAVRDAGRAALLAELAELAHLRADLARAYRHRDEIERLRDITAEHLGEAVSERNQQRHELRGISAELAETVQQRDEARQERDAARASECTALCGDVEQERDELLARLDEARAKTLDGDHPCLPLIVVADTGGNGLEVRCGNCGTHEPIGSGSEMDLAELRHWLDGHCETADGGEPW